MIGPVIFAFAAVVLALIAAIGKDDGEMMAIAAAFGAIGQSGRWLKLGENHER
tara:strand:- start:2184 stop:2342 length:159 start_codon:yes stop_codon:yes gene_type:complete